MEMNESEKCQKVAVNLVYVLKQEGNQRYKGRRWLIFNAKRALWGHSAWSGDDSGYGTHYAVIDTTEPDAKEFIKECVLDKARLVVYVARDEVVWLCQAFQNALKRNIDVSGYQWKLVWDCFIDISPETRELEL
jgi:hypothetical protein